MSGSRLDQAGKLTGVGSASGPGRHPVRAMLGRSMVTPIVLIALVSVLALVLGGVSTTLADTTILGLINLTMVISLYVFVGNSGVFSFGHSAFVMVGAYVSGILTISTSNKATLLMLPHWLTTLTLGPWPALLVAAAAAAAAGLLAAIPLSRMAALTAGLGTFAVLNIVYSIAGNWNSVTGGSTGLAAVPTSTTIGSALIVAIVAIVGAWAFQETAVCLRLRAAREDEVAARAIGIRVTPERGISLVLSALIGGMAGAVYAQYVGTFSPQAFYLTLDFTLVAMLVIGGRGSLTGAVIGSLLVTIVQYALSQLQDGFSVGSLHVGARAGLEYFGVALVTLGCVILRPRGLSGGLEIGDLARLRRGREIDPMHEALSHPQTESTDVATRVAAKTFGDGLHEMVAESVSVQFGGLHALDDVSVQVGRAEIVGLIGPNGAGKTTLLNVLTGYQRPTRGTVRLSGVEVTSLTPERHARRGVIRTFQGARLFPRLTVAENVEAACVAQGMSRRAARRSSAELLARFGLTALRTTRAEVLTSGQQRLLGVVRGLAARPAFLLLDEPAAGLNETETAELSVLLRRLPEDFGIGLLVVEHDMRLIFSICSRIHVLSEGRTIAEGAPADVRAHPEVIASYLGRGYEPGA